MRQAGNHRGRKAGLRKIARPLRLALYWGLPPVILFLIFRQLDPGRLASLAAAANPFAIAGGISLVGFKILAGAMRWHRLAANYQCTGLPFAGSLAEYWASLAVGAVTPGSLGSDVYRVAVGGRRTGRYGSGAFVIGVEKTVALVSCVALIGCAYPLVRLESLSAGIAHAIDAAYIVLVAGAGLLLLVALTHRSRWFESMVAAFGRRVGKLSATARLDMEGRSTGTDAPARSPIALLRSALSPRVMVPAVALSLAIHLVGALQGQIFMDALGYELPFAVNVFIAPLTMFLLSLPITVGGLGVREGVFVLCYGAFGVPAEVALLASLFFFVSVTATHALGAFFIVLQRPSRIA